MPRRRDFSADQLVLESSAFELPVQLDTQEKLIALRDDPLAGFLPFSHQEKSQATEMLDYLGNPKVYPAGLGHRLQEIFMRNRRDIGDAQARRAMFSLAYEYGDYAFNAQRQYALLGQLQAELEEDHFNPHVTIAEDFPDGHAALPAVIRFVDIRAVRESNRMLTPYDPLKVDKDRTIQANSEDDKKHKTVGDRYTAERVAGEVAQRMDAFAEQTTVAELRVLLPDVLTNEAVRFEFWSARLRDTRKHGAAWIVGKQLVQQLDEA